MPVMTTKNGKIAIGITIATFILSVMLQVIGKIWLVQMPVTLAMVSGLAVAGYFFYKSYKEENKIKEKF